MFAMKGVVCLVLLFCAGFFLMSSDAITKECCAMEKAKGCMAESNGINCTIKCLLKKEGMVTGPNDMPDTNKIIEWANKCLFDCPAKDSYIECVKSVVTPDWCDSDPKICSGYDKLGKCPMVSGMLKCVMPCFN